MKHDAYSQAFTRGLFWLSGIVIAYACVAVRVCPGVGVTLNLSAQKFVSYSRYNHPMWTRGAKQLG